MRLIQHSLAKMFGFPIDPRKNERVLNMAKKIETLGGLQFQIRVGKQGWIAECKNLDGILTGGNSDSPSINEIDKNIKDAIFSAFGIPAYLCDERMIMSPFDLQRERTIDHINLVYRGQIRLA